MDQRIRSARQRRALLCAAWAALLCVSLAGCNADNDSASQDPSTIGPAGGAVMGPDGSQVTVPAGALAADTPIAVARTSAGAPALPAAFQSFGPIFAFTPHGTTFSQPATVIVPFDPELLPSGATPVLYKTNAQGAWEPVDAAFDTGAATAQVASFSFFVIGNAPPQITRQPADATTTEPQAATFSVTALGAPPFSYQWQRSDDDGATFADIPDATATNYTTPPTSVAADDGARYRVIVSNMEGSTTSRSATLTVTSNAAPPTITTQPQDTSVAVGEDATFTVVAAGVSPRYQWQRSGDGGATFVDIADAANASYTLSNAQPGDDGAEFRAQVSDAGGQVVSNEARLTVVTNPPPPPPAATGAIIAAGDAHTVVRLVDGSLQSWGSDSAGRLGGGAGRSAPGPVDTLDTVVSIASGAAHTLAVLADGRVFAWGYNGFGQLGNGGTDSAGTPIQVQGINTARAACGGTLFSMVLLADGALLTFGHNADGQLGDGGADDRLTPGAVSGISNATAIACGAAHALALLDDGSVRAWGLNTSGQLGDGATTSRNAPVVVSGAAGVVEIAAGFAHSLARLASGGVIAWGANDRGQLGDGSTADRTTPVAVGIPRAFAIAAGGANSMALSEVLYVWGSNENAQLGLGSLTPAFRSTPAPVQAFFDASTIPAFAVGRGIANHLLAVRPDGGVWAWGANDSGQIGIGSTGGPVLTPTQVQGLDLN